MPAYGLIPDSPFIYAAQKAMRGRSRGGGGGGGRRSGGGGGISISMQFGGVVLYKPILNYELNTPSGMVGRHMHILGAKIMTKARADVGVKTGSLRRSIHMRHSGDANGQTLRIGSSLNYALAHHEGTRPHIINPTPPNTILRFSKGSKVISTSFVKHPGTKPNRYLSRQLSRYIK